MSVAQLFDTGVFSVIDDASAIQVGAKLYWYVANTSTLVDTYSDPELTVENTNPVLADADGRFPQMWLAPGLYKYVLTASDGNPMSPLVTVDDYRVSDEPETFDPDLADFLAGDVPLPIASGGTGQTSAVNAIAALGGLPAAGGTVTGNIVRSTKGVHLYFNTAAMNNGGVFLTVDSDPDPTSLAGQVWMKWS
jgi:hypothetical protein